MVYERVYDVKSANKVFYDGFYQACLIERSTLRILTMWNEQNFSNDCTVTYGPWQKDSIILTQAAKLYISSVVRQ